MTMTRILAVRQACAVVLLVVAATLPVSAQTGAAAPAPAPAPAPAEEPGGRPAWALLDAVGYGALGFAAGLAAAWDLEGDDFGPPGTALALVGASTLAGTVAGAMIGRRASRAHAEGRGVGSGHRAAVVTGVVLAGGTLGALAAVPLINPEGEGTFLGSDEQTLTLLVLGGLALGGLHAWRHRAHFHRAGPEVVPVLSGNGRGGLHLRVRF